MHGAVKFLATGDISFGWATANVIQKQGYDHLFSGVTSYFQQADLVLANLEGPVSLRGLPIRKTTRFRYRPECLAALKRAGIGAVTIANNHTLDYGRTALLDTLAYLKQAGIPYLGAGPNGALAHQPLIITINHLTLGLLAYNDYPYIGIKYDHEKATVARATPQLIRQDIERLRGKVDVLITSFHWGNEFSTRPNQRQRYLAHLAVDLGADLVIGHHPHVLQPSEIYKSKLIVYSLGNFIFAMHKPPRNRSAILQCVLSPNQVSDVKLIPLVIKGCRPQAL